MICEYCKRPSRTTRKDCYKCRHAIRLRAAYLERKLGKMIGLEMLRYLQRRGVE